MNYLKLTTVLLLLSLQMLAQPEVRREKREQLKSLKIAFITDELQLTPDEAAKFWPVFNAFEQTQAIIRRQKMKIFLNKNTNNPFDKITEKEAQLLLDQTENNEENLYQTRKKFVITLKAILPTIKILKLKRAEEKFNKKLLKQYKEQSKQ